MTINYDNIHQTIAALNQCAKENENRQTDTGAVRVSDLCTDVAHFLCKVHQDHKQWQETKDGKMHVYLFHDNDDGGKIADLWTTSVPDIGEQIILWDKGEHHHYEVTRRIYGANVEEKVGVWNLYVKPKRKGFVD